MKTGRIIRIMPGQYTVKYEDGTSAVAHPRGKLRREDRPVTGDLVKVEQIDDADRIDSILPRTNQLTRPAVSNVDQALIVTSAKDPDFSEHLLNRLIFLVRLGNTEPVIIITKSDLLNEEEKKALKEKTDWYERAGYTVLYSQPGSNDDALKAILKDKISVLCGQSGAGKSSLLNRLDPEFRLRTQEISKALGRGRHTTRHCELHETAGGLIADTPGFSSLDFSREDLSHFDELIPDFQKYLPEGCRFKDCRHLNEPDCCIKEHVKKGDINPSIYEDYRQLMEEEANRKKKY